MNTSHLTLFALLVTISTCSAYISGESLIQRTQAAYYCGRPLAMALSFLCDPKQASKRFDGTMYGSILANRHRDDDSYPGSWPWMPHHKSVEMNRGKRGIVEECCEKPCTSVHLMEYC